MMYRLNKVTISNTSLFRQSTVNFRLNMDVRVKKNNGPELTLLLGPNGTGKSLILQEIAQNIRQLYKDTKLDNLPKNIMQNAGEDCPKRLICLSPGLSDRFPQISRRPFKEGDDPFKDFYFYLGKRGTAGSFSPRIFLYKCIDYLADWIASDDKHINLSSVLGEFEFQPVIRIGYEFLRQSKAISEYGTTSHRQKDGIRSELPEWFKPNEVRTLINVLTKKNRKSEFIIDLRKPNSKTEEYYFLRYFNYLRAEKFLRVTSCEIFRRNDVSYDISSLSSGEANLFLSFIALSSVIRDNSLVLIDEPEISLHPNWQIAFLPAIKKIFKNFSSCHFIISSHSPYICSDIGDIDTIVRTSRNKDSQLLEASFYEPSTYGWSVEKILLEVFGVATVRNFYFEQKIRSLFNFVQNDGSASTEDIDALVADLKQFKLKEGDPLKTLIDNATSILDRKSKNV